VDRFVLGSVSPLKEDEVFIFLVVKDLEKKKAIGQKRAEKHRHFPVSYLQYILIDGTSNNPHG